MTGVLALKAHMLSLLGDLVDKSVLDVGCGDGEDALHLAERAGPGGWVLGVDRNDALIAEAQGRVAGGRPPLEFRTGDAQRLDLPDGCFDACRAARLLMHVKDPDCALAEMARVTRPGGRLVAFDFDMDAAVIDHPDRGTTRAVVRSFSDGVRHGWMGRQLRRRFLDAGLAEVTTYAHTVALDLWFLRSLLADHLAKAQCSGDFDEQQLAQWWNQLEEADGRGSFFAAYEGFIAAGTLPMP